MGYQFALLLTSCQSIKLTSRRISDDLLAEHVQCASSILNLAMDTTDSRTQHLTDHIYHIITFSAITLCRLVSTYEDRLAAIHDIGALDFLVTKLITWLKSIGLRSHIARLLGNVVESQQKKLRPKGQASPISADSSEALPFDTALLYPDFINAEAFNINVESLWPTWEILE